MRPAKTCVWPEIMLARAPYARPKPLVSDGESSPPRPGVFETAIATARRQQARLFELRAATQLAPVLARQGRVHGFAARRRLNPTMVFMSGKIKVEGDIDMAVAVALSQLLG